MSTAEQLAFSISTERRAIHALLWDDQDDLVRALVVLFAGLPDDLQTHSLFVSDDEEHLRVLRDLVESRVDVFDGETKTERASDSVRNRFWLFFLQQACSLSAGPWLNGWRRPMSDPPGTMLVIRHADFDSFQRNAPDLASFIGSRIFDSSTMLSVFSRTTYERLKPRLPKDVQTILTRLPGTAPDERTVRNWIQSSQPDDSPD
jgi:hypothetical protein